MGQFLEESTDDFITGQDALTRDSDLISRLILPFTVTGVQRVHSVKGWNLP